MQLFHASSCFDLLPEDLSTAFPKPKTIPENSPRNETITRECRKASHGDQAPGTIIGRKETNRIIGNGGKM